MKNSSQGKIGTTALHWFARGVVSGVMLLAAINALSYFFRTASILDLVGKDKTVTESIGFPLEIWLEEKTYPGGMFIDYLNLGLNLLIGLVLGILLGLVCVALRSNFNRWIEEFEAANSGDHSTSLQFSIKTLLLVTTVVALLISVMTQWHGTPQVLIVIYFLGPALLVAIAMLPPGLRWQHRVVVLTVLAFSMIGIALSSGHALQVPLDRVLLGIFVSWTPQSAFAAFLITVGLIARIWFSQSATSVA